MIMKSATPTIGKLPTMSAGGLFGSGPSWAPAAGHGAGPQSFDLSGLSQGINMLKSAPAYKASSNKYSPFQFKTPQLKEIGDDVYDSVFDTSLNKASKSIRSQAEERMRMLGQDFSRSGMSGPAAMEMRMKNAMKTGEDIGDIASTLSSDRAKSILADKTNVRDALFNAERERQTSQAGENFKAKGYGDEQARFMADDQFRRAQAMMDAGMALPQFQLQASQAQNAEFNQMLQMMSMMSGWGGK